MARNGHPPSAQQSGDEGKDDLRATVHRIANVEEAAIHRAARCRYQADAVACAAGGRARQW